MTADPAFRDLRDKADVTATSVAALQRKFDYAEYGVSIVVLLLAILGVVGINWLKSEVRTRAAARIDAEVTARFDKMVPERIRVLEERAQGELLRVAQVLALHSQRAFDAVLAAFGWSGAVQSLRGTSPVVRRAVIESLYEAQKDRRTNRAAAWTAVTELVLDDPSIESSRLFFRLALSSKRYQEGLEHYRRIAATLNDPEAGRMASAILRHVREPQEALVLATRFRDASIESAVPIATLQRDLGDFGSAHDVLKPLVEQLTNSTDPKPPEGWHRVLNTFIAVCLDRNKPADAVAAAQFVMRQTSRAVEVSTVGRLILALDHAHPARQDLLLKYRTAVAALPVGPEAATRARLTLLQIDGRVDEAVRQAREEIARLEAAGESKDSLYLRSYLGHLLMANPAEALDALTPAASLAEAKYFMAMASANMGQSRDAVRWLREAAKEQPKWAALARDQPAFTKYPDVLQLLSEFALPPNQVRLL